MSDEISKLVNSQLKDYRANNPGTCFIDPSFNIDIDTAYRIQDGVTNLRLKEGEKVCGYKVGCTGPGTTAQFGMDGPIRGTLFESEVLQDRAAIIKDSFFSLAIEAEMACRVKENGQIENVFPVIELHNYVFRAPKKSLQELIANNGINAGIILPQIKWQKSEEYIFKKGIIALEINDKQMETGDLWPTEAGPTVSLDWLAENLRTYGKKIVPGHTVLAGTALGLYPVQKGDKVTVKVDSVPALSCSIV
jgi:2-keto-4-pentenoate hydratase